jgi:hypothetical protein
VCARTGRRCERFAVRARGVGCRIRLPVGTINAWERHVAGPRDSEGGAAIPHPQFNDYAEFPDTYDVGVVVLDEPVFVPDYGHLPTEGEFEFLRRAKGPIANRQAVVVGYGRQGAIPAFQQDDWERYRGLSAVINTGQSALAGPQNFVYTNNPGQGSGSGGTCSGDSGGPAFWVDPETGEETLTVIGVNSYGITPLCNGLDFQFRTDTAVALDFLHLYIP